MVGAKVVNQTVNFMSTYGHILHFVLSIFYLTIFYVQIEKLHMLITISINRGAKK